MEVGRVAMTIVEHVYYVFAGGEKKRCDQFGRNVDQMVPVKNLGGLRSYLGYFYEKDREKGVLKISQRTFAEQLAKEYGIEFGKNVALPVGTKLAKFDKDDPPGNWPFRELVGSIMWLSTQTRPDISNAVRCARVSSLEGSVCYFRVCETD